MLTLPVEEDIAGQFQMILAKATPLATNMSIFSPKMSVFDFQGDESYTTQHELLNIAGDSSLKGWASSFSGDVDEVTDMDR